MTDVVITVENLSKKYILSHQSREKYTALRDVMANSLKGLGRKILSPFAARVSPFTDFEEFYALRDVSFEIKQGDRVGIIGRNGAGKSTLLKILSRITDPTGGKIEITGRAASLLEVGTGFHPELTGRENIYLNGAILGMGRGEIKRKFDEIVDFAEVEKFLDTPVKRYSSGMYVRLAFAVAAHLEPEMLIVDEVLAVGDAQFQKKCLGKMEEFGREGRTVLFVSHNMASVQALCTRGIVLCKGRIDFDGPSDKSISHYCRNSQIDSSLHETDLKYRKDRKGNAKACAVGIEILNKMGDKTNTINMGDSFSVQLNVEGKLKNAVIGILIGNNLIRQLCRGFTYESYSGNINIDGNLTILCKFDAIPLIHGTYSIHVWIGGVAGECADEIDNSIELNIVERDIFNTGKTLDAHGNVFFVKHQWEFKSN